MHVLSASKRRASIEARGRRGLWQSCQRRESYFQSNFYRIAILFQSDALGNVYLLQPGIEGIFRLFKKILATFTYILLHFFRLYHNSRFHLLLFDEQHLSFLKSCFIYNMIEDIYLPTPTYGHICYLHLKTL